MKGYVTLSQENGNDLVSRCEHVINSHIPTYKTIISKKFFTRKEYTERISTSPNWYYYRGVLLSYLKDLQTMLDRKDEIQLSLTCYNELIKLAKGEDRVNEIFILNY